MDAPGYADPPETPGPIDVHSHLIPGVDDGCDSVKDMLGCIEQLMQRGFTGSVCTPHVFPAMFPETTPANVRDWVAALQEDVDAAGLDYQLWPGGEVRIISGMIDWMAEHGVPTLGDSRYVLMDTWGDAWPDEGDELCEHLVTQGYTPILAHPERMPISDDVLADLLDRLNAMGVLLQGNFNSFSGAEGPSAATWAARLMREGRYFLLASDVHHPHDMETRFEGLALAEIEAGPEQLADMIVANPRKVLGLV